jgi:hypothetical protein
MIERLSRVTAQSHSDAKQGKKMAEKIPKKRVFKLFFRYILHLRKGHKGTLG